MDLRGKQMSIEEIRDRVEEVGQVGPRDPEIGHEKESMLRLEFIISVAQTAPEPYATMAREVLKSAEFDFPRWMS